MERLDVCLFEKGLSKSREQAKSMIISESVSVNGKIIKKPSFQVSESDVIEVLSKPKYVGRGGLKLEEAISVFSLNLDGKICLDVGASTGGFTDCMLKNGAKTVFALDVGHDQLDEKLKNDSRVVNLENTHIKDINSEMLQNKKIDFISVDVSFISLKKVIPYLKPFIEQGADAVFLFKPQFEAGKTNKGIVRDKKIHLFLLKDFAEYILFENLTVINACCSPILGGDGNTEFLFYVAKNGDNKNIDFTTLI